MSLQGRVALVTGGDRGIGRAIAIALARAGADVAIGYRSRAADADSAAAEIRGLGRRTGTFQGDVASEADVTKVVGGVTSALGEIDVLVCNAGIAQAAELDALDT